MIVKIWSEAESDLEEAYNYYEQRKEGLGVRFVKAYLHGVHEIAAAPNRWPVDATDAEFRKFTLPPFPFKILYQVEGQSCTIFAVADQRRRPGYWKDRLHRAE